MQKLLVYRDEERIQHTVYVFNESIERYNTVVSEFAKLGVGSISSTQEFLTACFTPKKYIEEEAVRTLTESSGIGFKVRANKLVELADMPDTTAFIDAANMVRAQGLSEFAEIGTCRKNGLVEIDTKKLDNFMEDCSIYAETKQEIEVYKLLMSVRDATERLIELNLIDAIGVFHQPTERYLIRKAPGGVPAVNLITYRKQLEKRKG